MRSAFIFLFLLALCNACAAQPGYMGKRFSAGYYLEFFPHANFSGNYSAKNEPGFEIEPEHHLNLTWVVNRRWELLVDVSRRNREYTIVRRPFYIELESAPDNDNQVSINFNDKFQMAQETYWSFGIRKYFWNQIAPVGLYHQFAYVSGKARFRGDQLALDGTYSQYSNQTGYQDIPYSTTIKTKQEAKVSFFSYGIGLKRPISKLLYFSVEANVQVPLSGYSNNPVSRRENNLDDHLTYHLIKGIQTHNSFDIRVGLGWMF